MTTATLPLKSVFTSDGSKFLHHKEAMEGLRDGRARPITTHIMPTDHCAHRCAFCSVHHRAKNVLTMQVMHDYLGILVPYGLKSVIISGGGNPILYRCPETGQDFNALIRMIRAYGLQVGLITDGMKLVDYPCGRRSWKNVAPETLDELTWIRISMAGLDHEERCVYVPDVNPEKTTLGFSWVYHDRYNAPEDKRHGAVSTVEDLLHLVPLDESGIAARKESGRDRLPVVEEQIRHYVETYNPRYVRLLPNCLQPSLIDERCAELREMANRIDPSRVFVQHKPPQAPPSCLLGYAHPVLNSNGGVFACDSNVLNPKANHQFANDWQLCWWHEVGELYEEPVRSLVDSERLCPGCVFFGTNMLLKGIRDGEIEITPPTETPEHVNFV